MSRPRFLADNDLNDAIVAGVRRREPAIEFSRLRDLGLATRSDPEVPPGRLSTFLVYCGERNRVDLESSELDDDSQPEIQRRQSNGARRKLKQPPKPKRGRSVLI
jgi:hypothetical protein